MSRRAGQFRHRIDIESPVTTRDSMGQAEVTSWEKVLENEPAAIFYLSGREFSAANAQQAEVVARIQINYHPQLNNRMRVVWNGLVFSIRAVLPDPKVARWLNLMVDAGRDPGG